jgi:hypothetical protein
MKNYFQNWQWLKDTNNDWSYARVLGAFCVMIIQPILSTYVFLNKEMSEINNVWQWCFLALPTLTSVALYICQVIKENKSLQFQAGDKTYGFTKEAEKS